MIDRIVKYDHNTVPFKIKEKQIEEKLQSIGHGNPKLRESYLNSQISLNGGANNEDYGQRLEGNPQLKDGKYNL